ncbi:putative F-box domain-containing protein [Helianthus annuus]|nr:putative F-box domain-containing protein [Helianthus annuus]
MAADNRSLVELPTHNLEDVLLRLPLRSLFSVFRISNPQLNLIKNDRDFARMCFEKSESQLMICSPIRSDVHLIHLDADTRLSVAERVEIKPNFRLPLFGFDVTHSSNGLVLLENSNIDQDVHRCMVCNPVTGEYIWLPDSPGLSRHVTCAFFYSPVTNQFKIFRTFHRIFRLSPDVESESDSESESDVNSDDSNHDPRIEMNPFPDDIYDSDSVSVSDSDSDSDLDFGSDSDSNYSESDRVGEFLLSGSDAWERVDGVPFSPQAIHSPCYLNNATHWLCSDESVHNVIVSFNFETGQFGEIPGPPGMTKDHANKPDHMTMVLLYGCLSIFDNYTNTTAFDVWKMNEYGVKESWSRAFVIDTTVWGIYGIQHAFTPVICRNNGEVVMVSKSGYIVFHDLLKTRGRILFHSSLEDPYKAVAHTPSLMPLSDVTRGTNMVLQNVLPGRFAKPELNERNYLQLSTTFSK